MYQHLANESQFEERVIAHLSTAHRIILRKNSQMYNGFIGRRKPDLVTIEENLEFVVWEIKSPLECLNNDRNYHFWLNHPTPDTDYLREGRNVHASNASLPLEVRGWCVVIDCELRYWIQNQGNSDAWRLPFSYASAISQCGIAAPVAESDSIERALNHLSIIGRWNLSVEGNLILCRGILQ